MLLITNHYYAQVAKEIPMSQKYLGFTNEPRHEISNNEVCTTSKGSDQYSLIPKNPFNMLRAIIFLFFLLKYFFWYLLVLYVNFSVKPLNFAPKWSFSIFSLFWRSFCYHCNGKSQSNLRILHFGYYSNKLMHIDEKQVLNFSLIGGEGKKVP